MKLRLLILSVFYCCALNAQTVVPVGAGSYASEPPTTLPAATLAFANRDVNVPLGNTRPIPTNDWWTDMLMHNFGGNLHAYPVTIKPQNYGCDMFFPVTWAGQDMVKDFPLRVKGVGFTPVKNIAQDWNDWGLKINLQDAAKYMNITIANGMPMAWYEVSGFNPYIEFGNGVTFFKPDGSAATFPYTGSSLGVVYGGKTYGIYAPDNTSFTITGSTVTMVNPGTTTYFTVAALKQQSDLLYYNTFAYSIPRDTKVSWNYRPLDAKIDITYTITTDNLKGGTERRVVQGFIPHHYKDATQTFAFNGRDYATPRGLLKCAVGNIFSFTYDFTGVLGHMPAPNVQNVPNPYDPLKMKTMTDAFATRTGYGNDSYWGGKDLVNYSKFALISNEIGNTNFASIRDKSKNALIDWLTYTPGETAHYFARYDKWKALVGFAPSFGSEQFTDNHFHYGYHIHAAALLGMIDKPFINSYGPMLTQIVKQFANWDRTDTNYPFLRTFSPWRGHSYAGGTSAGDGNNQESTSEAMQSWAGMFMLGDIMGNIGMRDAAAFGYLSESRAIKEYWLDVDNQNLPATFPHPFVGIVFDGGMSYGTWFSARPIHIHGIQWLPWAPYMNHMMKYPAYLQTDYALMKSEEQTQYGVSDESNFGADWANVALSYQQMFNPAYTAQRFDQYWAAPNNTPYNNVTKDVTSGLSYYYMHSNRTLGTIQWNSHTSAPNSTVYFNASTGLYSYVGFNSKPTVENVVIYTNGIAIGTINVPAYTFFNRNNLDVTLATESNNFVENEIKFYPNPFSNTVTIQSIDSDKKIESVKVYDMLGKFIEEIKNTDQKSSMTIGSNYQSGAYIAKISGDFGTKNIRLIKK
jgi:endoglucanase Acf2